MILKTSDHRFLAPQMPELHGATPYNVKSLIVPRSLLLHMPRKVFRSLRQTQWEWEVIPALLLTWHLRQVPLSPTPGYNTGPTGEGISK